MFDHSHYAFQKPFCILHHPVGTVRPGLTCLSRQQAKVDWSKICVSITHVSVCCTVASQTISDVRANPRQAQRGARTDSNERNSSKHSGGGSGRPKIQRPPSQTAGQAETATANRFAALQSVHMEGVEATDISIT